MIEKIHSLHWYELGMCLNALLVVVLVVLAIFLELTYLGIYIVTEQKKNYKSSLSWLVKSDLLSKEVQDYIRVNRADDILFLMFIILVISLTLSITWPITILLIIFCLIVFPAKLIRKRLLEIENDIEREARKDRKAKREDKETKSNDG